jgi:hypothetical protein
MIRECVQVLFCLLLPIYSVELNAQTKNSTKSETGLNPVLMMSYDPSKVKYEAFPDASKVACAKELSGESSRRIYARIKSGESEYLANMGFWHTNAEEYNNGELIRIQGNKCKLFDIGGALMALPPKNGYHPAPSKIELPWFDSPNECTNGQCHLVFRSANEELLLRSFVKDAIQRAITAYGGDAPFRTQACKPKEEKELSDDGYIIVLQELKAYCSTVPGK